MRAILVRPGPQFSVQDVADGWAKALGRQLGDEFADFNLDARLDFYDQHPQIHGDFKQVTELATRTLLADCMMFRPDWLIVVSGFFIHPKFLQVLRGHGIRLCLLATESPYEDDNQALVAPFYDLVVLNDPTNLRRFEDITPTIYLPHAYDPELHHRRPVVDPEWVSEFCFVGTGYPSRVDFFEAVDFDGIDVCLAGNWQGLNPGSPLLKHLAHDQQFCLANADAHDLYSGTLASANLYRREANRPELSAGWSMGPREVELAAHGCFFLTEERPENRAVLPMVPTFDGPHDFGRKLRLYLADDLAREQIAADAQGAVAPFTFENHARLLLDRF